MKSKFKIIPLIGFILIITAVVMPISAPSFFIVPITIILFFIGIIFTIVGLTSDKTNSKMINDLADSVRTSLEDASANNITQRNCEYCGSKLDKNKSKCQSCGATIKKTHKDIE